MQPAYDQSRKKQWRVNGKPPPFELILKNEKTRQYDRIALLFVLLNSGYLVYQCISAAGIFPRVLAGSGAAIVFILGLFYLSWPGKKGKGPIMMLIAILIVSFTWMMLQQWALMLLSLATGFLYFISGRKMSVVLMNEHIVYPSFPARTISWPELSNVILRDGLLTIIFRTDRYIQQKVDESLGAVNEQELNEFCRQQLAK